MRFPARLLSACLFIGVSVSASTAQAAGNVAKGEELARQVCARCHNVEPSGPFKLFPPSFAAIAVYRSPEQIRGKILYPQLHSGMPQLSSVLTPDGVVDLVAYITSLEKP